MIDDQHPNYDQIKNNDVKGLESNILSLNHLLSNR